LSFTSNKEIVIHNKSDSDIDWFSSSATDCSSSEKS